MATWTCPKCDRGFGRRNQSHTCVPAGTLDSYFGGRPAIQGSLCDAVTRHLESLGPLTVDAVQVGVLYKRAATFAEVRGMRDRIRLSVLLSRAVESARFVRSVKTSANRWAHFIDLKSTDDIDDAVLDWLTESYFDARE